MTRPAWIPDNADISIEPDTRNVYVQWSNGGRLWSYKAEGERLQQILDAYPVIREVREHGGICL